jgi:hypothetical protein
MSRHRDVYAGANFSPYAGNGVLARDSAPVKNRGVIVPPSLRFSAAVPSVDTLCIATLSWTGQHLRLVPRDSAFLLLQSETQAGVQRFSQDALAFLTEHAIPLLLVRKGPGDGPRSVATGTTRMATALQTLPVPCPQVHTQKVLGWVGRTEPLLPLPQPGFRAHKRALQAKAIETAAYGISVLLEACRDEMNRQRLAQLCAQVFLES